MPENQGKAPFKCLRCGSEFELPCEPGRIEERTCPACGSNSVRHRKQPPLPPEPRKP